MNAINEYQNQAGRTDPHPLGSRDALLNSALGLVGEAGEVAEAIKKHAFHGKPLDRDAVTKELGDVLWYLARMAAHIGVDLSEVAIRNIVKLRTRYPEGFSAEASAARVDEARDAGGPTQPWGAVKDMLDGKGVSR